MRRDIFSIGIVLLNLILTASCNHNSPLPGIDFTGEVDTLIDIEGNSYKTIGIGSQIWMAENLRTTKLNDGTIIPNLSDDSIWVKLQTAGLCWYNNDSARFQKFYGPLYNFYAVNTSQLCPIGWHVPDKSFSMSCYDTHLNRFEIHKREGLNVRCIDFASLLM